jgi:acyl-CoA synthetase (AMP-forming)/AMP-acid ligase II
MAAFKATVSWAPNFAYDLCAHHRGRMEADLDLTHWRLAFNSAEPVRVATLRAFEAAYGGCGFASRAMQPCYGLAEATLLVAGGEADGGWRAGVFSPETLSGGRILARRALEASVELVSCGRGAADGTLGVVEPDTRRRLSEGEVGEIWIRSPSVAAGYWNNPEATKAVFEAFTSDGEGPWLRTGDLGVARDGELYIAGRLKDVIIVGGVNYYPQDVEAIVERSHPALRAHSAIAFPIETEDGEGMAVVCEIDRRREAEVEAAILALRRDVFDELGLGAAAIGILRVGGAPKTPSGKVQRSLCRAAFEAGELPLIHGWRRAARRTDEPGVAMAAAHDVDAWTRARLAGLGVRMEEIDLNGCWSDLGVSSIDLVGLPEEVARNFGVHMKLAEIFDCASIMEFCDRVQGAISSPSSGRNVVAAPRLAALG